MPDKGKRTGLDRTFGQELDSGLICTHTQTNKQTFLQVGPRGADDDLTTFGAFCAAAAAAAVNDGVRRTYVLLACAHSTVASFMPDGRVILVNSLGRSLSPNCGHAHALEFSTMADFVALFLSMVLPTGAEPTQVAAHRVADARPESGEPELHLYMPQ